MENGLHVSLREKIARNPRVQSLIGTPLTRLSVLRNRKADSQRYDTKDPSKNYELVRFEERAAAPRAALQGLERLHVCLTGWPNLGYDRQHPDELPPAPAAGAGRPAAARRHLPRAGLSADLPRAVPRLLRGRAVLRPAVRDHEEDESSPPQAFPGTRFGETKEGRIPFMRYWDGASSPS